MAIPVLVKCLYILLFYSVIGCNAESSQSPTSGKKFITAFLQNYDSSAVLSLHIVSYDRPALVRVSVPDPAYRRSVLVNANDTAVLTMDSCFMLSGNEISKKVITVTSNEDISLIVFSGRSKTYDPFLNLPFINLGTKYYIVTYTVDSPYNVKQFAIANSNEHVQLTITVSGSLIFNGTEYTDKESFAFAMEPNEAVQFQSDKDLTGTKVVSTKPVAVFSGDQCITVPPSNCDHIAEQLYPVDKWSNSFIVFPLMKKLKKDIITIVAAENNTVVSVHTDEGNTQVLLQEGAHVNLALNRGMIVNASRPVMVTQLSTGDNTVKFSTSVPFLVNILPLTYFSNYLVFVTMDTFYNYILVVSQGVNPAGIILDGKTLGSYPSENSTLADFTATRIYLGETGGRHVISHDSARFAVYIYGIGRAESYGYPMGKKMFTSKPEEEDSLTCLPQAAVYTFPSRLLTSLGLSVADVHLIDPTCHADQKDENWVIITAPFDSCGTKHINETGEIGYVNTVYGTVRHTPINRLETQLKCKLLTTQAITIGFVPQTDHVAWLGHYSVSFTLYHSAAFDDPVLKTPYKIDLNETLYIQMEVDTPDSRVEIFTESCVAAPSLHPKGVPYNIIENGCPKDSTLASHQSNDSRKQRFSFHVFTFEDYPQIYVLCEVVMCHSDSSPNRCAQGCLPPRHKRDISTDGSADKSVLLSQGPVVIRSDSEGLIRLRMNSERRESYYYVPILGVLSGGSLISILALILQRKYYLLQSLELVPLASS